eukprot:scaffold2664_cov319-Prasinococcus_capsulatus_cf.AAC.5
MPSTSLSLADDAVAGGYSHQDVGVYMVKEPLLGCEFPECPICPASACCFGGSYTNGEDTITKQVNVAGDCVCDFTIPKEEIFMYRRFMGLTLVVCFCYRSSANCAPVRTSTRYGPDALWPGKCCGCDDVASLMAAADSYVQEVVEELNNSFCDAVIGVGLVNGVCQELSGCSKPEGVALYNTLAECQQLCEPFACPAIVKACPCGSGYATPLPGDPFCTFPDCPEYAVKSYMCSEPGNKDEICPPMKNGQPNYTCFVAPCQFATCDRFPDEDVECVDCYTLCVPPCLLPAVLIARPIEQACAPIFVLDGEKIDCKCGCADLNDDGSSNIQDVILLVKYVISNGNPTDVTVSDCGFAEANLNDDDDADVLDIITLINILIGKLPHPCGWEL